MADTLKARPDGPSPAFNPLRTTPPLDEESSKDKSLQEFIEVLIRRRKLVLIVFLTVVVLGMLYTMTRKKIYDSSTKLVVVTSGSNGAPADNAILSNLTNLTQGRNTATQQEIIDSVDLLDEAFHTFTPQERQKAFGKQQFEHMPTWAYRIDNKPDTDVIVITVQSYVPDLSARMANQIATTYLNRDLIRNSQATRQGREYVAREMARERQKLSDASGRLANFKRNSGFINAGSQLDQATIRNFTLRSNAESADAEQIASAQRLAVLANQLKKTGRQIPFNRTVQQNPEFAQVVSNITNLQAHRAELMQEFTPQSVEVQTVNNEIKQNEARLKATTQNIVTGVMQQENPVYDALVQQYATEFAHQAAAKSQASIADGLRSKGEAEIHGYPAKERALVELSEDVDVLKHTYETLSEKYYNLLIQENSDLPNGIIASKAEVPQVASYPRVFLSTIVLVVVGVILSIGIVGVTERLDVRVHDASTAETLTGLSVLSAIPETPHSTTLRPLIGDLGRHSAHGFLESYRILRNNVNFSRPGSPPRILAVTSAGRGEGKSTTSVNLAIALSMDKKKVLLIDGDLRRPSVHKTLDLVRDEGLTSVVSGQRKLEDVIVETPYENLSVLVSGPLPSNPTEFLNSVQTREVVMRAAEMFDYVIIDSPPSAGLSDIQVISNLVDGVVLLVAVNITTKPMLRATIRTLRQAGAPVLGLVLNRIDTSRPSYGYYYSYYYYAYSEDEDDGKRKKVRKKIKDD